MLLCFQDAGNSVWESLLFMQRSELGRYRTYTITAKNAVGVTSNDVDLIRGRSLGPGPRCRWLGPGPRCRSLGPGPRCRSLGPGPRCRSLGPGPRCRSLGPAARSIDHCRLIIYEDHSHRAS